MSGRVCCAHEDLPQQAEELFAKAEKDAKQRYETYRQLAEIKSLWAKA